MTTFLCSLGLLAAILPFCPPAMPVHNGYIEGEYVLMAPREAGRIERMAVVEGQIVKAGDLLFKIDTSEISRQVDAAKARLAQAEAQLADLETGERREELAVLEAALAAQEAALADANRVMARQKDLYERRVVSKAALDDATAKRDSAEALTQQARRRIEVAKMPARGRAIDAARQHVEVGACRCRADELARVAVRGEGAGRCGGRPGVSPRGRDGGIRQAGDPASAAGKSQGPLLRQ